MIAILTGPIRTGKTTALLAAFPTGYASGVLQPVADGRRRVLCLRSGQSRPLEASAEVPNQDQVQVGRFVFSASTLRWANGCIVDALDVRAHDEWVVIDEVGPLELDGRGIARAVQKAVTRAQPPNGPRLLLVVRDGLVDAVCDGFGIVDPLVLRLGDRPPGGPRIGLPQEA